MSKFKDMFNKREVDLTSGDTKELIKKFILYALPIILVGLLQLLYNSFDLIVVQQHDGLEYGAAVGSNGSLIGLITNAFVGLSIGANVVVSRYYGQNNKEKAERAVHTSLVLGLMGGIVIMIVGVLFAETFLGWMKVDLAYRSIAANYLRIYFLSMPFMMLYNFGSSIFRGIGDSKRPLFFLLISGLLNVALNYLFVFAFNMKEVGVGTATVISQGLSCFLVLFYLYRNKGFVNFRFKKLRIHGHELRRILKIGIPSGLEGVIFSISNVLLQSSVNEWSPTIVAANTDAANIEGYTYTAMFSIASATPAFISANMGRGFAKNITKIHLISTISIIVVGLIFGFGSYGFNEQLLKIYMGEQFDIEVVKYAQERLRVVLFTYFLCGLMDNEASVLRGLGYSFIPMIFTILGCCVFRVFWDRFVYSSDPTSPMHSLGILYLCYPISWAFSGLMQLISYFVIRKKRIKKCDFNLIEYNNIHKIEQRL